MRVVVYFFLFIFAFPAMANELVRIGTGARAIGMANLSGLANDPLTAMSGNPALMTSQVTSLQINVSTIIADSSFTNTFTSNAKANSGPGFIPDLATVWSPVDSRFSLGAGIPGRFAPEADISVFN